MTLGVINDTNAGSVVSMAVNQWDFCIIIVIHHNEISMAVNSPVKNITDYGL